jgi:hypothetical protein
LLGRFLATTLSASFIILAFRRHASICIIAPSANVIMISGNMFSVESKKKIVFN